MSRFTEQHSKMQAPGKIVADALHQEITSLLRECTEKQIAMLDRVWPNFRASLDAKKLTSVLELVQRTVSKNRAGRAEEQTEAYEWDDDLAHWRERTYSRDGGSVTLISAVSHSKNFSVTITRSPGVDTSSAERRLRDELHREVKAHSLLAALQEAVK